jgi:hypothetical protein
VTPDRQPRSPAELRFGWFTHDDLDSLGMFDDSRNGARLLFDRINHLATDHRRVAASSHPNLGA